MTYNPEIHHRKSNRLPGYDYTQKGLYFVTLCTSGRECLFGDVDNGQMIMNGMGKVVAKEWIKTGEIRANVELDEWVIMPNHFHAIVGITDGVCPHRRGDLRSLLLAPTGPLSKSIGAIMAGFKSAVTRQVNVMRQTPGLPVWQRNYWDHVIRDEEDFNRIREYIQTNPLRWELDALHREST
ncbi:transposase [Desulfuromonas thiophila]|uniref:REP element-mobilizing transposase RayT n=1 Tax=Desulfuromonas thiophila TaxID=57664 RepID=A0A1G6ZNU1_9BACT|nr:transposase [Desulfuromonas thiophila]SDE03236.1 REP element-mobilizing transposase RayT [Desulfuromonas thiophila]